MPSWCSPNPTSYGIWTERPNTLFMSVALINFFAESIIQRLIEPMFVRHCPKYRNGHNDESQISISLKPLCKL